MYREATARRTYRCARCRDPIEAGTRYMRIALPPGGLVDGMPIGNKSWWHDAVHGREPEDCGPYSCYPPLVPFAGYA